MIRTYTYEQFLKLTVGLGFRFSFDLGLLFACFFHFVPVLFAFVVLGLVSSV